MKISTFDAKQAIVMGVIAGIVAAAILLVVSDALFENPAQAPFAPTDLLTGQAKRGGGSTGGGCTPDGFGNTLCFHFATPQSCEGYLDCTDPSKISVVSGLVPVTFSGTTASTIRVDFYDTTAGGCACPVNPYTCPLGRAPVVFDGYTSAQGFNWSTTGIIGVTPQIPNGHVIALHARVYSKSGKAQDAYPECVTVQN